MQEWFLCQVFAVGIFFFLIRKYSSESRTRFRTFHQALVPCTNCILPTSRRLIDSVICHFTVGPTDNLQCSRISILFSGFARQRKISISPSKMLSRASLLSRKFRIEPWQIQSKWNGMRWPMNFWYFHTILCYRRPHCVTIVIAADVYVIAAIREENCASSTRWGVFTTCHRFEFCSKSDNYASTNEF